MNESILFTFAHFHTDLNLISNTLTMTTLAKDLNENDYTLTTMRMTLTPITCTLAVT